MNIRSANKENTFVNVTHEISKYGKSIDNEMKIISLTLDNTESKMKRFIAALRESIRSGAWIIVENAHLLTSWPKECLYLLYVITAQFLNFQINFFFNSFVFDRIENQGFQYVPGRA
jgi:hypothetical protein